MENVEMHFLNKHDSLASNTKRTNRELAGNMNIFFFFLTGLKNKRRARKLNGKNISVERRRTKCIRNNSF